MANLRCASAPAAAARSTFSKPRPLVGKSPCPAVEMAKGATGFRELLDRERVERAQRHGAEAARARLGCEPLGERGGVAAVGRVADEQRRQLDGAEQPRVAGAQSGGGRLVRARDVRLGRRIERERGRERGRGGREQRERRRARREGRDVGAERGRVRDEGLAARRLLGRVRRMGDGPRPTLCGRATTARRRRYGRRGAEIAE